MCKCKVTIQVTPSGKTHELWVGQNSMYCNDPFKVLEIDCSLCPIHTVLEISKDLPETKVCDACDGRGTINICGKGRVKPCEKCGGSGSILA